MREPFLGGLHVAAELALILLDRGQVGVDARAEDEAGAALREDDASGGGSRVCRNENFACEHLIWGGGGVHAQALREISFAHGAFSSGLFFQALCLPFSPRTSCGLDGWTT